MNLSISWAHVLLMLYAQYIKFDFIFLFCLMVIDQMSDNCKLLLYYLVYDWVNYLCFLDLSFVNCIMKLWEGLGL